MASELIAKKRKRKTKKAMDDLYDFIQSAVAALVFCILLFSFFVRIVDVIGPSMRPTLNDMDKIVVSKLFYKPKVGDIVVFRKDSFKEEPLVKRIIAVAGQTVDINFSAGEVLVDNVKIEEPYIAEPTTGEKYDFVGPITVPKGCVFVMGDNRLHSTDSRYSEIGFVDERCIMGKVWFTVFPVKHFGSPYAKQ
ncbi:MAG: signal peptidase I [Ruminococcaceae bacterium]|nr:signal peptidase I [Oscillospiraceae bacterium]